MRLHQRLERLPPLQAPIPTKMVVSAASVASVLVRCYGLLLKATSEHERPAAVAAIACTACVQQVQRGARDVHGLLIAGGVGPCPLLCALLLQLIKSKRCSADCRTHGLGARHSAVAAKACCT